MRTTKCKVDRKPNTRRTERTPHPQCGGASSLHAGPIAEVWRAGLLLWRERTNPIWHTLREEKRGVQT